MNPDEKNFPGDQPDIEARLERLYDTIQPDADCAARLEARLSGQLSSSRRAPAFWARWRPALGSAWRQAAGLAALALVAAVIAFGMQLLPERSLAPAAASQTPAPGEAVEPSAQASQAATAPAPTLHPLPVTSPAPELPLTLAPEVCSQPLTALSDSSILSPDYRPEALVSGGSVESGDFTFELWLVCDKAYNRTQPGGDYFSEIDGLGLLTLWRYNGPDLQGEIRDFAGFEPYVRESGTMAPAVQTTSSMRLHGMQFPVGVLPDFSPQETYLRYLVKAQTPDGVLAGAALSFVLQRQTDGYRPVQVRVDPLLPGDLVAAESDPAATPAFPTLDAAQVYPQLQEVRALLDRWQESLRASPGWVHLRLHNTNSGRNDLYPGVSERTLDEWYLLDENGLVIQSVSIDRAPDGRVLQQSYSKDGQTYNLTFSERNSYTPYRFDIGSDLYTLAFALLRSGESFERSEIVVDGKPAWLIQFADTFSETVTLEGAPAAALVWRDAIDPGSGARLYSEQWLVAPDGAQQLIARSDYEVVERVPQPSPEALALLNQPIGAYTPHPPMGAPAPADFDPAYVDLEMNMVAGGDFNQPSFWYGDLYAGDYLLGRVDFGALPGGRCDRSADGRWLAFNYDAQAGDSLASSRLRWFDLRNPAVVYGTSSTESLSPDVSRLNLQSPAAWSPAGYQLAFYACDEDNLCGIYIVQADTGSVRLLVNTEFSFQAPVWKWDASQLAWLTPTINGLEVKVAQVSDGSLVYSGALDDAPPELLLWWVDFPEGLSGFERCEHPKGKPLPIQAFNLRQEGETVAVDVCFVPPDNSQWDPARVALQYGGQQVSNYSSSPIEVPSELAASGLPYRCQSLSFAASGWNAQTPTTLLIHDLRKEIPEGDWCTWYTGVVQPALDARQSGIRLACTLDHALKLEFLEKPEGMSDNQANRIVYLVYIQTITFPGPWTFALIQ